MSLILKKIKNSNIDYFLFILLLTSFAIANILIHLSTILIVARCIYLFFIDKNNRVKLLINTPKVVLLSLGLFFLFAAITNITKIEETKILIKSFREYKWIIVFFFYTYFFLNTFKVKWFYTLNTTWLVLLIVSIYSLFQFFFGQDPFGDHRIFLGNSFPFRSIGFFGIPITFSYMLGGLFFVLLAHSVFTVKYQSKVKSFLVLTTLFLLLLALFSTQTRIAWVASLFTLTLVTFLYIKKNRFLILVFICLIPLSLVFAPQAIQHRVVSIFDVKKDGTNNGRLYVWRAHWDIFKKNPILGNGISNYHKPVKTFFNENNINSKLIAHAHNTFIHVLSSQGILGFLSFIVFFFYFLWVSFQQTFCFKNEQRMISIGLFSSMLFLYICGLTEVLIIDSESIHLLSFIWAMVLALEIKREV